MAGDNAMVPRCLKTGKSTRMPCRYLQVKGKNRDKVQTVISLYSPKKFKNFELSVDWNAGKMGNSGIFFSVREVPGKPIYYAAPEVQVLDNVDATDNKIDSHLAGSLYDMLPADPKNGSSCRLMEYYRN